MLNFTNHLVKIVIIIAAFACDIASGTHIRSPHTHLLDYIGSPHTPLLECLNERLAVMSDKDLNEMYGTLIKLVAEGESNKYPAANHEILKTDCSITNWFLRSVAATDSPLTLSETEFEKLYLMETNGTLQINQLSRDLGKFLLRSIHTGKQPFGPTLWTDEGLRKFYAEASLDEEQLLLDQIKRVRCLLLAPADGSLLPSRDCRDLFKASDGKEHRMLYNNWSIKDHRSILITLILPSVDHVLVIERFSAAQQFVIYQSSLQSYNLRNYLFDECSAASASHQLFKQSDLCYQEYNGRNPHGYNGRVLDSHLMGNWLDDLKLLLCSINRKRPSDSLFERVFWSAPRPYLYKLKYAYRDRPISFILQQADGNSCGLAMDRLLSIQP